MSIRTPEPPPTDAKTPYPLCRGDCVLGYFEHLCCEYRKWMDFSKDVSKASVYKTRAAYQELLAGAVEEVCRRVERGRAWG